LLSLNQSDRIKAASVGVGVFSGILPIWGFQLFAGLFLAVIFRLNKALVIIASNISIPPMIPLIVFLSYKTGSLLLGDKNTKTAFTVHSPIQFIGAHLKQYIYGSIIFAIIAGFLAALLAFILLKLFKRKTISAF
jgi:uncharacterized protein (DUF2062 family)